jgi:hypothetical protein
VHSPPITVRVVGLTAVKHTAVVPDEKITNLPTMLITILRLSCPFYEIVEKRPSVLIIPSLDGSRMGAYVVVFLAGYVIRTYQSLAYRR